MIRNRICSALLATTALAVSMVALSASSAMAAGGEYTVFNQCPVENEEVSTCIVARTESGEIKLGKQGVPIEKTQTLQGGLDFINSFDNQFVEALNKETLTKTPQKVPGGLLGIKCAEIKGSGFIEKGLRKLCEKLFEEGAAGVYATTELAAPASSVVLNQPFLEIEEGTALFLPVKIKLENALLGPECYIGSNKEPINLELTTGTSGALKGKLGTISTRAKGGILVIKNNTLVDSGFKAPGATGCAFGLLDGLLNSKLGLPATTEDTAVLNNTVEEANAELVAAS